MRKKIQELSRSIYSPLFAERDSLVEAYNYALDIARASKDNAAVMTAIHVLLNSLSKQIDDILDAELAEEERRDAQLEAWVNEYERSHYPQFNVESREG